MENIYIQDRGNRISFQAAGIGRKEVEAAEKFRKAVLRALTK